MERVLLAGGAGFIGSYVAKQFIKEGDEVVLYHRNPRDIPFLKRELKEGKAISVKGDVLDPLHIIQTIKNYDVEGLVDLVVAYAQRVPTPTERIRINILGTLNLVDVARILGLRRMIFISSGVVYGKTGGTITEQTPPTIDLRRMSMDTNIYATEKILLDVLMLRASELYETDFVSVKPGGDVYGPGMTWTEAPIHYFLKNALDGKPTVLEQGGDHTSEWTYVKDFARGICMIYKAKTLKHRLYNLAVGRKWSLFEMADIVRELVPRAQISLGPNLMKPGEGTWDPERGPLDYSRAREELGYEPEYNLKTGMQEYLHWLKAGEYPQA